MQYGAQPKVGYLPLCQPGWIDKAKVRLEQFIKIKALLTSYQVITSCNWSYL